MNVTSVETQIKIKELGSQTLLFPLVYCQINLRNHHKDISYSFYIILLPQYYLYFIQKPNLCKSIAKVKAAIRFYLGDTKAQILSWTLLLESHNKIK